MNINGYRVEVRPLGPQHGRGFVAFAPQLLGCLSDGESPTIALLNLEDAIGCWLAEARAQQRPIPIVDA